MPKFYVTWSGWLIAEDSHQAENIIENAIASKTEADLDSCDATNEDTDEELAIEDFIADLDRVTDDLDFPDD